MKGNYPDITHETVVFTKHAKERLALRKISEDMILQVMRKPSKTQDAGDGKIKFIGKTMGATVHAVCTPISEENKWIIITLWVRGENDAGEFVNRKSYRPGKQSNFSKSYGGIFFVIAVIIAIVFYLTQMQ